MSLSLASYFGGSLSSYFGQQGRKHLAEETSNTSPLKPVTFGEALIAEGEDRQQKAAAVTDSLREEMEILARQVRDLVLVQPPVALLGYLWGQFLLGAIKNQKEKENTEPDKELALQLQFTLEYLHAIWGSHSGSFANGELDEEKAQALLTKCDELRNKAIMYCMASSVASTNTDFGPESWKIKFNAMSTWLLIRGHRYQVLEEEFFQFVMKPHDDALLRAYGITSQAIAAGVQSVADTIRTGHGTAYSTLKTRMQQSYATAEKEEISLDDAIERLKAKDPAFVSTMDGAMRDLFFGGVCNLSRHTKLPETLLDDLVYAPGAETEFFKEGPYAGTPFRTLPGRIRPLIKFDDGYYATDGQFVRDSAYRAIQRGLLGRLPEYREEWNRRQKTLTESAFPAILFEQLKDTCLFEGVYFKDVATGQWVETDLVGVLDDTLLVIEAKAGVGAMHSPATNFDRHVRAIRELVLKAYTQCRRFVEYLANTPEAPIYRLESGQYQEVAKLRLRDFRRVVPIGLTVESFSPFSAMCKELPEVTPILGSYPFISMSVDDLFVLNRFLKTTGELFHYLDVRQHVAGIPRAMMFDEMDHLGAYISQNRFDQTMREQLEKADMVWWDSFSDNVDRHFEADNWEDKPVPQQSYPGELIEILETLSRSRPAGWLKFDAHIRDLSGGARDNLASVVRDLMPTLKVHPVRRFLLSDTNPIQIWLYRDPARPTKSEIQYQGEIACLVTRQQSVMVLTLKVGPDDRMQHAGCTVVKSPPIIHTDYPTLAEEAARQRNKMIFFGKKGSSGPSHSNLH